MKQLKTITDPRYCQNTISYDELLSSLIETVNELVETVNELSAPVIKQREEQKAEFDRIQKIEELKYELLKLGVRELKGTK